MIFRGEPLALEVLAGNLYEDEVQILDLKVEPDGLEDDVLPRYDPVKKYRVHYVVAGVGG